MAVEFLGVVMSERVGSWLACSLCVLAAFLFGLAAGNLSWRPHLAALDRQLAALEEQDEMRTSWLVGQSRDAIQLGRATRETLQVRIPEQRDPNTGYWYELPPGCEIHHQRGGGVAGGSAPRLNNENIGKNAAGLLGETRDPSPPKPPHSLFPTPVFTARPMPPSAHSQPALLEAELERTKEIEKVLRRVGERLRDSGKPPPAAPPDPDPPQPARMPRAAEDEPANSLSLTAPAPRYALPPYSFPTAAYVPPGAACPIVTPVLFAPSPAGTPVRSLGHYSRPSVIRGTTTKSRAMTATKPRTAGRPKP